jgi:tripartite ATP-independent transporter DctM subunit
MSPEIVGLIGMAVLIVSLFAGMWIGLAMAFLGFLGFAYLGGINAALGILATVPYSTIANYAVAVVPLFLLMGNVASSTGISGDLYKTGYTWMGHLPGGLAMGTIGACAGFAAICGSSIAAGATMGKVVLPEMKKYKYDPKLATGSVAAGGTLGILIPPSIGFIVYGLLTEESIGKLFMAGVLPGILLSALFIIQIYVWARYDPQLAPPGPKVSFAKKLGSLRFTWAMLLLFLLVMGGIYMGFFTPGEAGAMGAFGSIVITFVSRRLNLKKLLAAILDTGQTTAMVFLLLVGAMIFMRFLTISKLPFSVADFVSQLAFPPYLLFALIIVIFIIIGMFMEILSSLVLTLPIIYPTILALGFDPIWFGVIMVVVCEMGLITPPVGMNVFVIAGVSDVPLGTIFRGALPFVLTMLICVVILTIFPQIVLFLPNMMR